MSKSVYSLVLADQVVEAIDRLAYSMNTSRSALINQVLADYASFVTPESRMRDIFSRVEQVMNGLEPFQVLFQPSEAMMSIRSPLRYKYKPTLRYSVELYRESPQLVGELRVSARTQSQGLLGALDTCFALWLELENKYLAKFFPGGVPGAAAEGRLRRSLRLPPAAQRPDSGEIADAITAYIRLLDGAIKLFFENLENLPAAARAMEEYYLAGLREGHPLV